MSFPKKRTLGVLAGIALLLPLAGAAPATAAPSQCQVLTEGPTPGIAVDLDGDGNPELHVPSLSDVTLCVGPEVVLPNAAVVDREQCGGFGSCMKYYVAYDLTGYVHTGASLCYTSGGRQTCTSVPSVVVQPAGPGVMCIGYDLREPGGNPCVDTP